MDGAPSNIYGGRRYDSTISLGIPNVAILSADVSSRDDEDHLRRSGDPRAANSTEGESNYRHCTLLGDDDPGTTVLGSPLRSSGSPPGSPLRSSLKSSWPAGAMMSPDDSCDCVFEHIARAASGKYEAVQPPEFDLRKELKFPSPRDQGTRGTCAAMVGATIKEIQEARDCGFTDRMSPEFIYFHRDNRPSGGMYGRNVFQILQKIGSVPENIYPYRSDESAQKPSDELYEIANHFKIANFARVTTTSGLKKALLEIGPCYIQLPLYSTRPEFWRPSHHSDKPDGGHALTVIGYTEEGFILQNSWGAGWNDDGCIVFPYDEWSVHWECWVSVDEHTEPDEATNVLEKSSRLAGTPRGSESGEHRGPKRYNKSRSKSLTHAANKYASKRAAKHDPKHETISTNKEDLRHAQRRHHKSSRNCSIM